MSERTRWLRRLTVAGVTLLTTLNWQVTTAEADVWPSTASGVPQMVTPQFLETGVPAFTTLAGGQNPAAGVTTPVSGTGTSGDAGGFGGTGSAGPGFVTTSFSQYLGQAVGTGQCVALVQAADPSVGLTATWHQGDSVQGNTALASGTVIATFNQNGQYANATDGSSHTAIYLGQNAQGIQVEDQWAGHATSTRTISWGNPSGIGADTGSQFHVVTHS